MLTTRLIRPLHTGAAIQGRLDHHWLSQLLVSVGPPPGFGRQGAYNTRPVGQAANDHDESADRAPVRDRIKVKADHETPSLGSRIQVGRFLPRRAAGLRFADRDSWLPSTSAAASRRIR